MSEQLGRIDAILHKSRVIMDDLAVLEHVDRPIEGQRFSDLAAALTRHFPGRLAESAIQHSLVHLLGVSLTHAGMRREVWRLSANSARLKHGRVAQPWRSQARDENVAVQVIDVGVALVKKQSGFKLKLFVLTGSPAGSTMERAWSLRFSGVLAQCLGFSPPWGNRPFSAARQFADMRFSVLLTPQSCREQLDFKEIRRDDEGSVLPASFVAYNRDLLKQRDRYSGEFTCPRNFPTDHACHTCPVGKDACPIAVHAQSFFQRICPRCQEVKWFDPQRLETSVCVGCQTNQILHPARVPQEGGSRG